MEKDFIRAAKNGDASKVKELLTAAPTLLDARDADGSTALHCAAWKGHLEVVQVLIGLGALVNVHNQNDHWGTTPLHAAAHANQPKIVEALIAAGADINAVDGNGKTPLHHTTFHKATAAAKVLAKNGGQ